MNVTHQQSLKEMVIHKAVKQKNKTRSISTDEKEEIDHRPKENSRCGFNS